MVLAVGVVEGACVGGSWDGLRMGSVVIVIGFTIGGVMVGLLGRIVCVVGVGDCERRGWEGGGEKWNIWLCFYEWELSFIVVAGKFGVGSMMIT